MFHSFILVVYHLRPRPFPLEIPNLDQSKMHLTSVLSWFFLPSFIAAQLSGTVGPLTTRAAKTARKTCNVLSYGGKADNVTDLGPALNAAFAACKTGGTVIIPTGNYAMATWVTLSGGNAWALQLDGIIFRAGTAGGTMIGRWSEFCCDTTVPD